MVKFGVDLYHGIGKQMNQRWNICSIDKDTKLIHLIFSSLHLQYHSLHTCIPLILALSMMLLMCCF